MVKIIFKILYYVVVFNLNIEYEYKWNKTTARTNIKALRVLFVQIFGILKWRSPLSVSCHRLVE